VMHKNNFFWRSVDFQVGSGIRNLKAIEQYLNAGTYEVDEAKRNEEAVALSVLEYGGESQQILKFTSSLKNIKNFSLDGLDSELFLPRTNVQN
ncbi:MAG: hypothetical protein ABGX43_08975, partial [Nitrospinaceae bacterium]